MTPTKGTDVPAATAPIPVHVIGNAFVQQYYKVLYESPDMVYMFYRENSRFVRPSAGSRVGMDSVTTIEAINKKIMEMDMSTVKTEIDTVVSHSMAAGGVFVLVKGRAVITTTGGQSRAFSQSFLLAPQERGYYLLRDSLHYVGECCAAPGAVAA